MNGGDGDDEREDEKEGQEMFKVIGLCGLLMVGCVAKKPMVFDYASKADIVELQGEMIVQMEALLEEVRQDNRNTRASIKRVVSECLCPSEMK